MTLTSLYEKYDRIDKEIILNIYNNSDRDLILCDFQLKEMASDMFQDDYDENPPPTGEQFAYSPFGDTPPKLGKHISGMSTGIDDNSSNNDME